MPTKPTSTTTESTAIVDGADHDRVVAVSIRADGTADQTPAFEIVGDVERAKAIARRQFSEIAVASVDAEMRVPPAEGNAPSTEDLRKAQDSAISSAKKKADAFVEAHHKG